jgi:hypothetical protein
MKAEFTPVENAFRPVSITLTFETQNELDAFGALFNYAPVCEAVEELTSGRMDTDVIRGAVVRAGGSEVRLHPELHKLMTEAHE